MSRRRPDRRREDLRQRAASRSPIEVICTGRDTHAREFFERVDVNVDVFEKMTDEQVRSLGITDWELRSAFGGRRKLEDGGQFFIVESGADTHMTRTWRCSKCGRTIPWRDVNLRRVLVILARNGVRTMDLSRLDRVALS